MSRTAFAASLGPRYAVRRVRRMPIGQRITGPTQNPSTDTAMGIATIASRKRR